MAQVGPLRMCLVPDVVSPHAVFLFLAVLGVLHHGHSVVFVRIFETVHCLCPLDVPWDQVPCFHDSVREEISPRFQSRCLLPQFNGSVCVFYTLYLVRWTLFRIQVVLNLDQDQKKRFLG
jgi:hypothetical protein